jgi:uncharacterized protein (DUF952 family)
MSSSPESFPELIYHICAEADWRAAQAAGTYHGSDAARADGFLHMSTREQVAGSLAKHYPDPAGFIILRVRTELVRDRLRWEPSRGGALFPHCYGDVPLAAVAGTLPAEDWPPDGAGA